MTHKEYNGWYNFEAWLCSLWIDNDQGLYNYWRQVTDMACRTCNALYDSQTDKEAATYWLSERLKEWVEENDPLSGTANLYADLMGAAISEINFYEIAEHWIDDQWEGPDNREDDDA